MTTKVERLTAAAGAHYATVRTQTAQGEQAIRRAAQAGATIRQLAEATGLSVGKVNKITRGL